MCWAGTTKYSPYRVGLDAGDDFYFGGSGNDQLLDSEGNDELRGGNGDDFVGNLFQLRMSFEAIGNGRMYGNAGNDQIFGGPGDDLLSGGTGDDRIGIREIMPPYFNVEAGNDEITAGAGNDVVQGGTGDDRIQGDAGNDQLYSSDMLTGGNPDCPFPGMEEVDELIGDQSPNFSPLINQRADRFVLGNSNQVFYNDRQANSDGIADYALIRDFSFAQNDVIQLKGRAADYWFDPTPIALGRAIFLTAGQIQPGLIAIVQGDNITGFERGFVFV